MAELFGVVSGMQQAQQDDQSQQLATMALQEGSLKMESEKLAIDQTKQTIAKQSMLMTKLANMHEQGAKDPVGQAKALASQGYEIGNAYIESGLPEQGFEMISKASTMEKNSAEISASLASQMREKATLVSNLANNVKNSADPQKAWQNANMVYQAQTGQPSPFANHPYSPDLVDTLVSQSQTALQKADQQEKDAQTNKAKADIKLADATVPLRKAQTEATQARAAALGKVGGKPPSTEEMKEATAAVMAENPAADPNSARTVALGIAERTKSLVAGGLTRDQAQTQAVSEANDKGQLKNLPAKITKETKAAVAQSDLRNDVVNDIDGLIKQIQSNPGIIGAKGYVSRAKELVSTTTGVGDQSTPANTYQAGINALTLKLPKALTGASKSAKDERAKVDKIVGEGLGNNATIALNKLNELKSILQGQSGNTIRGKDAGALPQYANEAAALAAGAKKGDRVIIGGQTGTLQ